ncbi:alkaline phosphatase family protein [Desulfocucumis palustris]|uniref:alkaline phosphatase family protein n=1 Tax=Desulfocucumis palustris TaxID=1898651 RepID=UPI000CE9EEA1|nr:alkaline phosphatase family protein [Desulfocucumis palustris]
MIAKWKILYIAILIALLFIHPQKLFALPDSLPEEEQTAPARTSQIMLLVVDGLQSDALQKTRAPNINGLGSAGVKVDRMCLMPPDSRAAQIYSIFSGSEPARHGYLNTGDKPGVESILNLMQKRGNDTLLIDGTGELKGLTSGLKYFYSENVEDDSKITELAIKEISEKKPFFSVMVLSGPYRAMVRSGEDSREYLEAVAQADIQVGRLLGHLHQQGLYQDTLIVVCGTVGAPPLIIRGNEFSTGKSVPVVSNNDIAPTLAYLQGINMSGINGLVLWDSLRPGPGRPEIYMLQQRVKDLSDAYSRAMDEAGRLERKRIAVQDEKADLTREKYTMERKMKERDQRIDRLNLTVRLMKVGFVITLALFIIALLVQFKVLKKRYLFFT